MNHLRPSKTLVRGLMVVVCLLGCPWPGLSQDSVKSDQSPAVVNLGQKIQLLPFLPKEAKRAEYPITMRAEADEHGLYLVFDLEGVVLQELSRVGSPFYIDLFLDFRNEESRGSQGVATLLRIVGRFDDGQMAVERISRNKDGKEVKAERKIDAEARLSLLRSGSPRVSLFVGREEIGDHPWRVGDSGQDLPIDVIAHFADFSDEVDLELTANDPDAVLEDSSNDTVPGEPVYPEWHRFVFVRNTADIDSIERSPENFGRILLHKFQLADLPNCLRSIGEVSAEDDYQRRAESAALMTILDPELRGGVFIAREHQDEAVRVGARRVLACEVLGLDDAEGDSEPNQPEPKESPDE